ncbi:hypothetical protein BJX96DRAFT_28492 [Aspergillus floccosus]
MMGMIPPNRNPLAINVSSQAHQGKRLSEFDALPFPGRYHTPVSCSENSPQSKARHRKNRAKGSPENFDCPRFSKPSLSDRDKPVKVSVRESERARRVSRKGRVVEPDRKPLQMQDRRIEETSNDECQVLRQEGEMKRTRGEREGVERRRDEREKRERREAKFKESREGRESEHREEPHPG